MKIFYRLERKNGGKYKMLTIKECEKVNNLLKAIDDLEGMSMPINIITDYIKPLKDVLIDWRNREDYE